MTLCTCSKQKLGIPSPRRGRCEVGCFDNHHNGGPESFRRKGNVRLVFLCISPILVWWCRFLIIHIPFGQHQKRHASCPTLASAYLLNAYEQAIGTWDVTLQRHLFGRRRRHHADDKGEDELDSILFPYTTTSASAIDTKDNGNKQANEQQQQYQKLPWYGRTKQNIKCRLYVRPNGTFELTPLQQQQKQQQQQQTTKTTTATSDLQGKIQLHRIPIRGKWKLEPNPYCITDRHYDELTLISNPRVKKRTRRMNQQQQQQQMYSSRLKRTGTRKKRSPTPSSPQSLERATLELRCRLYGRYGSRSIRDAMGYNHGVGMGRMTHGTILLVRSDSTSHKRSIGATKRVVPWWQRRIVCGTFRACPVVEEWDTEDREDDQCDEEDYY